MNSQTTMTMWIIFIAVTVLTKQCQGVSPYCNITSVEEGQDATLVIHFSENVGISQTNFSILHRAINSSKDIEILKCHFPNGNLTCEHHQPCCSHDVTVNETFRVLIHKVTHDKEGLYAGVVMPIINGDTDYCELSIKGVEKREDVSWIVAVTVSAVVLLVVIILAIVIFRHCKSKQKDKSSKDRLEGDSNEENKPLTTKPESTSGHEDEGPKAQSEGECDEGPKAQSEGECDEGAKAQSEGECDEEKALLTKFKEPIKNADTKDNDENLLPNDSERSENEKSTDLEEPGRSDSPPTRRKPYKDTLHRNFDNTLIELVYKVQERESATNPITAASGQA